MAGVTAAPWRIQFGQRVSALTMKQVFACNGHQFLTAIPRFPAATATLPAAPPDATSVVPAAVFRFRFAAAATGSCGNRVFDRKTVSSPLSRLGPPRLPRRQVLNHQVSSRAVSTRSLIRSRFISEPSDLCSIHNDIHSSSNSRRRNSSKSSSSGDSRSNGNSCDHTDIFRRQWSYPGRMCSSSSIIWKCSSSRSLWINSSDLDSGSSRRNSRTCSYSNKLSWTVRGCSSNGGREDIITANIDDVDSSSSRDRSGLSSNVCDSCNNVLPGGACRSSSSIRGSDIRRRREDAPVLFLGGSTASSRSQCCGSPISSLCCGDTENSLPLRPSSASFSSSSRLYAAPPVEAGPTEDRPHTLLSGDAACWPPQAEQLAVADSVVRRCYVSLPRGGDGNKGNHRNSSHSSRKGRANQKSVRCFTFAKPPAVDSEDRGDSSSEENSNSTTWGTAAGTLIAAAAAVTAMGRERDCRSSCLCREPSVISAVSSSSNASSADSLSLPSSSFCSFSHRRVCRGSRASVCCWNPAHSRWGVSSGRGVRGVSWGTPSPPSRCCGIVGYVGDQEALPVLLQGLEILQNRGYDSCGISSVAEGGGTLVTTKYASRGSTSDSLNILREKAQQAHAGNRIGIGHTRWATHGSKTDANAHPHHDWKDRVSVVHNGTINNFATLKQALQRRGCTFRSETDSEVIANLIGWHLDNGRGFEEAVKDAIGEIQGTWGLCVLHKDYPDRLVLARNGSPLLVGAAAGGQVFVASEPAALAQHTNQYIFLKDGEIAVITAQGVGQLEATRPVHCISKEEKVELSPHPFPHWTVKEIYEQPQALARAINYGGRIAPYKSAVKLGGLDQSRESLLAIKNLLICGCGTSLYAGIYGELIMQWLGCLHQVRAVDAAELELHAFPKEDAGILLLSQSGETLDTVRACQLAEIHGIKKFSVVNQVGSLLARLTDCGVYVNAGREVAVASTKAFSCQVTVLSLIAAWFFQNKSQHAVSQQHADRCTALMDAIQRLPVYAGMTLNCRDACASVAAKLTGARTIFVLGKGFGYPVALEGALKIKEVGCVHAEGFAAGALKHGPFALIDEVERTPVIMLLLSDQNAAYMLNAAQQVKARGAHVVCITDIPEAVKGLTDDVLVVPSNGPLTALLACIPLQLLAYELAVAKGINPDKPRGLAKTVTVF